VVPAFENSRSYLLVDCIVLFSTGGGCMNEVVETEENSNETVMDLGRISDETKGWVSGPMIEGGAVPYRLA
jgi:hypothetical protein